MIAKDVLVSVKLKRKIRCRKKALIRRLLAWRKINSPCYPWRETANPYHILVAEMLLRKTRAAQVINIYKLFIEEFPSLEVLACSDIEEIHRIVRSLGLNGRSKWIKNIAIDIYDKYGNAIPSNQTDLESAIGSGRRYLLNAVKCFAFGQDTAVFDVNIKRILKRLFSIEFARDAHKSHSSWKIASLLIPPGQSREYNWAMLDLGKMICTEKNPKCEICPLSPECDYASKRFQEAEPLSAE